MHYRREIDGLRAIAVVPVVLFHAGAHLFSGGYVGVDVFFVISGYLITTILIEERVAGTYSIWGFYERRARRILPALFVVLLVSLPFAYLWLPPYPFEDFSRSMAFAALFISNVHFLEHGGYFDVSAELRPLLHTWSLAVEEQFYLIFPLVLFVLGAFARRRYLIGLSLLALASLGLAEWAGRRFPVENFYFTPSRLWELLAGSICAVLLYRRSLVPNQALSLLGLAMILFAIVGFDEGIPTPSLYMLVPVVGTCLIILFAGSETFVARLLSMRLLVGIGLISYSAYLWHQPLFAFARIRFPLGLSDWALAGLAISAFVLAALTWKYVEQPFRGRAPRALPGRRNILAASATAIAAFATVGLWIKANDGLPHRLDTAGSPFLARLYEQTTDHVAGERCVGQSEVAQRPLCEAYPGDPAGRKIAILGDSHARTTLPAFENLALNHGATIYLGDLAGCPPLLGVYLARGGQVALDCQATIQGFVEDALGEDVDTVVFIARWSLYLSGDYEGPNPKNRLTQEPGARIVSETEARAAFEAGLATTLDQFLRAGVRVVVFHQMPQQRAIPGILVQNALLLGLSDAQAADLFAESHVSRADNDALQRLARDAIEQVSQTRDVTVVSFDEAFAVGDAFAWFDGRDALFLDDDHLSSVGALSLQPIVNEILLQQ